jgi:hypothetical protein
MLGPMVGEGPTCVKAGRAPARMAAAPMRQKSWRQRRRMSRPHLGYSMPGIVVYLNAIRQAFLNAGQGLRGYLRYIP